MDIIEKIIKMEYEMFDQVNEGGARASCQDDKETFYAMRRCQFAAWNEEMRESYLRDLSEAAAGGYNLVTEKYARMMKYTAPEEYAELEPFLRPVTLEKEELVNQIHAISMEWSQKLCEQYPRIASGGRSLEDDEASQFGGTSISTYLRGELLTYSERTLRAYLKWQQALLAKGESMDQRILEETVKLYGFTSLEEAEANMQNH